MFGSTSIAASTLSVTPHGSPATHTTRSTANAWPQSRDVGLHATPAGSVYRPSTTTGIGSVRGWLGPPAGVGARTPGENVGWRCGPIAPNTPPLASVGRTATSARSARPSQDAAGSRYASTQ